MLDYIIKYDIYIFDINNAIINVEEYHYRAWLETLQEILGNEFCISFTYFCEKFHPKDSESIKNYLTEKLKLENYQEIMIEKNKKYINILNKEQDNIRLIEGVENFIELIINNNKKFIIVSDTFKDNIDFFIKLFPILNKASEFYYRELFDNKKFDKNIYIKIINKFVDYKVAYFTYYIIVIDALYNSNIELIYINKNESDYHNNLIIKDYHKITYVKDYYQLDLIYLEKKIINTLRLLSVDMINNVNSGHPGMPLGCAPIMYVLWCKIMYYNSSEPLLYNRDRFILSNGHGCVLLYSMLYLLGYNYTLEDLKNFRQLNSITHGHPEFNPNLGIEVTTGPLGQGIANGVGMAIASKKLNLNNNIYVMCGDGCLMEGISYEACSLAGHLELNNLILLYDNNSITIDGNTNLSFTENTRKRFKAHNWNVLEVLDGDTNINDIYEKLILAKKADKPTIILITTTIGYGTFKSGTNACHGTPLGNENTIELKRNLGFDINKTFFIDNDVKLYFKNLIKDKNKNIYVINKNNNNNELLIKELNLLKNNKKNYATRDISNFCLNILCKYLDNIIVGSADLAESTKTLIKSDYITRNNFIGKYIHYGIREHAMTAIANGLSTYYFLPIISTFLVFINYCLNGIRLAALSKHKVIYILTHDSVWLGEDGPTHQPIESLTILRSIPNLIVLRPCDIDETVESYKLALENDGPTCLILSRQPLKYIDNKYSDNIFRGGYIIYQHKNLKRKLNNKNIILIATGSEVELGINVAKELLEYNITIVSMISMEIFNNQETNYKNKILPNDSIKISIEAGSSLCWYKYANYVYSIDTFGSSGRIEDLKIYYKFTVSDIKKYIIDIINI
jgi:transketolase